MFSFRISLQRLPLLWVTSVILLSIFVITVPCSGRRGLGQLSPHELRPMNIPYVTLYENENFRGDFYTTVLGKKCVNLPDEVVNWASSLDTHRRCLDVCVAKNCAGKCTRFEPNNGAQSRLTKSDLNDKIVSLKSCYVL